MGRSDALVLAERHLATLRSGLSIGLVINDAITEEHEAGYVFFYNSAEYWRTGDMLTGLAGNGPILVRHDGRVVDLPSNQSVEVSLGTI